MAVCMHKIKPAKDDNMDEFHHLAEELLATDGY